MGNYGRRFAECRRGAGLKQVAAAKALGISQSTISCYETDRAEPTIDVAVRMASLYGVSLDYLLGLTDSRDGLIVKTIFREGD